MMRYRTEIDIPQDRYVCVQLPVNVPAGRAVLTVIVTEVDPLETQVPVSPEPETDRLDIEWWEEFDDDTSPGH